MICQVKTDKNLKKSSKYGVISFFAITVMIGFVLFVPISLPLHVDSFLRASAQEETTIEETPAAEPQPDPQELLRQQLLDDLKRQLEEKEREAAELDKKADELNTQIEDRQKQKTTINREIANLNDRIKKLQLDIKSTTTKISRTNLQIEALKLEITEKTLLINKRQTEIRSSIKALNELFQQNPLEVLLNNQSLSDFLAFQESIEAIQKKLTKELQELRQYKTELTTQKQGQETLKSDLSKLKTRLTDQNSVANWQKGSKSNLLTQTKNQEMEYRKLLTETNKKREEIAREIFELEDKIRLTIDPTAVPRKRPGLLIWPVASQRITQGYGSTKETGFQNDFYNFHNGIDIASPVGTEVKAAAAGHVVGIGDTTPYAYGKWIAVDHGNNLVTMYAHLSVIKVKNGQQVFQGDIIGYSGSTGYSTGPHLHFTAYVADTFKIVKRWYGSLPLGGSVSPMDYL